ncbi:D-alanine--D-alanine ligase [Helicobacter mustelae]|uniref:D-alanine--D-alanine ligase n=1 Tax=Helicobacter mustelae TaxID=217 RepID=UPI000E0747D7|nr:D-alanine--D-alanine ligase [Helicobacter mustelae]STP12357.1 D-alanine--D-alanine ligase [Helicobacter mustelae]
MTLCILFGGASWEHEISIVSAITLKNVLKQENLLFIFLDEEHRFYHIQSHQMQADFFAQKKHKSQKPLHLDRRGFFTSGFFGKNPLEFDILLNLVHGADGEDGTLAGLLDFYHIPYIGPRVEASVLSFNKLYTKIFAKERGIPTLPFVHLTQHQEQKIPLDFPLIIKPARLGSSIGISIAKDPQSLNFALDQAFEYDSSVLVEPFFSGIKEYNLAGCKIQGDFVFSLIEEPGKKEFLDFENKYLDFSRDSKIENANLSAQNVTKMQKHFEALYENCFEGALIRCDFFIHEDKIYINEINPIPGSMANYLFEDFEKTLISLCTSLPKKKPIFVDYQYIKKIQKAK